MLGLPRRVRAPPLGTRIRQRKQKKIKNKGSGVICAPSAKQGIAPVNRIKIVE